MGGRLRLPSQILLDLDTPLLIGLGGVDLEFETVGHIGFDVGDVAIELLVPPAHLIDGAILFDQQRVIDAGLVLPDFDVLQEALADTDDHRLRKASRTWPHPYPWASRR